jgi:periplasmic copper chaperone A
MARREENPKRYTHFRECLIHNAIIVVGLVGLVAAAPEVVSKNITITNAWVHETSGSSAVLHVVIANTDRRADRLVRASTPMASKVAIWNQLGKQSGGFSIPGGADFVIGDGFPRVELLGLSEALRTQSRFRMLLVFEQAGKITIDVAVEK